jgi:DNA-binding NtrC family response regulator
MIRFHWRVRKSLPNLEVFMTSTVILAVGLDSSLLESQSSVWQSAGYIVTTAGSIREAIIHFRDGDFDLVLLGHSLPAASREKLTFLIRASGSSVPVVYISNPSNDCDSFADATIQNEPTNMLKAIGELMANRTRMPAARSAMSRIAK